MISLLVASLAGTRGSWAGSAHSEHLTVPSNAKSRIIILSERPVEDMLRVASRRG